MPCWFLLCVYSVPACSFPGYPLDHHSVKARESSPLPSLWPRSCVARKPWFGGCPCCVTCCRCVARNLLFRGCPGCTPCCSQSPISILRQDPLIWLLLAIVGSLPRIPASARGLCSTPLHRLCVGPYSQLVLIWPSVASRQWESDIW